MKRHIFLFFILFAIPVLVHSVTEDGITITKLSMKPLLFNERRDPAADSPYNAFDGDVKTAALYSDFILEFSKPVTIDQIKIMNGNSTGKDVFKRTNRERDIEITLYAVAVKPDKKVSGKKTKKIIKKNTEKKEIQKDVKKDNKIEEKKENKIEKKEDKKIPEKGKESLIKEPVIKTEADKIRDDKSEKSRIEKEKIKINEKKPEIKQTENPGKVVFRDEYETSGFADQDDVELYFTASETIVEPVKKSAGASETIKTEPVIKDKRDEKKKTGDKQNTKNEKKKSGKTPEIKGKTDKTKTPAEKKLNKTAVKKTEAKVTAHREKEKRPERNIIEITNSKKEKTKDEKSSVPAEKKTDNKIADTKKENTSDEVKSSPDDTEIKKTLAGEDKPSVSKKDKPAEKTIIAEKKKIEKRIQKQSKKEDVKSVAKKTAKSNTVKKPDAKEKTVKAKIEKKTSDKNRIEIIESKKKTEKDKLTMPENRTAGDKKTAKPADEKKTSDKSKEQKKESPKMEVKKTEPAKAEVKKTEEKKAEEKKTASDVTVKKMTGVVRIENDKNGRVLVYSTLKDSMDFQSIDLQGEYSVTKIEFRTRDDEYYTGIETDRSGITEISFLNNGKKITLQGIDPLKKAYIERYSKNLTDSISGETFIMYENNDIALRVKFRKDGKIEYFDRFKCSKKGDADCTSLSMPDMWRVTEGKLYMRYHTLWRVWKYELDSQSDMLSDNNQDEPPRWMKLYYQSDNGFTDKYLELYRSEKGVWAE